MPKKPSLSKNQQKEIALERINSLFQQAEEVFSKNKALSNRYVELARKIAMKVNLPIPRDYKARYCKHCNKYFRSGNYRVRSRKGMVVYYCLNCKKYMKFKII